MYAPTKENHHGQIGICKRETADQLFVLNILFPIPNRNQTVKFPG